MKRCRKKIKNTDDAIVGVVSTFLIVGLLVAVVSVIQTVYIPKWMEQQEAEHMEDVGNQFAQLKYSIGQHILTKQKGIPISTSITLGSKELPFLMSSRAFGSVNEVNISFTITNISTVGGKSSMAGYGTYPIQTEFSDYDDTHVIQNVSTITIGTEYQNAWHRFINGTLRNQGLNYNGYGTNYVMALNESGITVEFNESTTVNLNIKLIQIDAQVAPGWIENIKG